MRSIKILSVLVMLILVSILVQPAVGVGALEDDTQSFETALDVTVDNPCTGESVHLTGGVRTIVINDMDPSDQTHWRTHHNYYEVNGQGLTSGTMYIGVGVSQGGGSTVLLPSELPYHYEVSWQDSMSLISQGGLENYRVHMNFHLTITPDLIETATVENYTFECMGGSSEQGVSPTIIDLGTLGGYGSMAYAVNDRGMVVGESSIASDPYHFHAFLWDKGTMIDLGTLSPLYKDSQALKINQSGQIIGNNQINARYKRAFVWENGQMIDMGTLSGDPYSIAVEINNGGQVLGYSSPSLPSGFKHPFLWANGTLTDLHPERAINLTPMDLNDRGQVVLTGNGHTYLWENDTLTDLGKIGGYYSTPIMINEHGQIIGRFDLAVGANKGYLWENGSFIDLETLGGCCTTPIWINEQGQIVGSSRTASGSTHAFLWQNGTMTDLGTLGGSLSQANEINPRGQIVGSSTTAAGDYHAVIWENGNILDLGTLGGISSSGTAINNHGQVVGQSTTPSGQGHAIIWMK